MRRGNGDEQASQHIGIKFYRMVGDSSKRPFPFNIFLHRCTKSRPGIRFLDDEPPLANSQAQFSGAVARVFNAIGKQFCNNYLNFKDQTPARSRNMLLHKCRCRLPGRVYLVWQVLKYQRMLCSGLHAICGIWSMPLLYPGKS